MATKKKGGKRPGAGRPKGAKNKRSQALRDAVEAAGYDPNWAVLGLLDAAKEAHADGDIKLMVDALAKAAPFLHAKLSSIDARHLVEQAVQEPISINFVMDPREARKPGS